MGNPSCNEASNNINTVNSTVDVWGRLHSAGTMLYGGDYNPEQWPENIWAEDMKLFHEAGINEVTLNVFSWATLQPSEDEYDFSQLDRIVETVTKAGMNIVMATSTGALPAWMSLRHPDVNRVDFEGRRNRHRERHNACINSPTYRKYSVALAGKLAERYAHLDNLVAWHVSNEYGGFCWCDICAEAFRAWLKNRYGSIEALNQAWNTAFWSHTYHSFDEIFPPNALGDHTSWGDKAILPAFSLDYKRFYGECVVDSYNEEKAAIRQFDAVNPVTTNMMGTFENYDYFTWRAGDSDNGNGGVDVVSWDSYPSMDTTPEEIQMRHDLMRAVGRQEPWMLMEQTPSRQNWMAYCYQKRPGQMRQMSWQAIAHGADTIQFFQLRQNRSGCEKFHGAVIGSDGTNKPRQFRESAELGQELKRVSARFLGSKVEHGRVAVVFDWNSRWGLAYSVGPTVALDYVQRVQAWYTELRRRNVPVDIVNPHDDLRGYDAVFAPCLYMTDEAVDANLRGYVEAGGRLVIGVMGLLVDMNDSIHQGEIPVPLRDLAGVWAEETDSLEPAHPVPVRFGGAEAGADGGADMVNATTLFDVVHADAGTETLATYEAEYYAGTPAVTFRPSVANPQTGLMGGVTYVATFFGADGINKVLDHTLDGVELPADVTADYGSGVEITRRIAADGTVFVFLINPSGEAREAQANVAATDVLTGTAYQPGDAIQLGAYGVAVLEQH
ncbi:beta-galactosidase [Bifidobacterium oedipodis]|uniref:beta-galactosidase n=1 Tax=Bifidobacterium oedipodis TaxID=2675322 RepID=A0A7Y0EQG7_9BIFI|nr:beta-galactosidase [Bifidobacterium sp. DSM 109957]NMM94574.1 beta-galactosidase [Bifidobacterium sp. DSM 109957]